MDAVLEEKSLLLFFFVVIKWFVINSTVAQFSVVPGHMKVLKIVAFLLLTVIVNNIKKKKQQTN